MTKLINELNDAHEAQALSKRGHGKQLGSVQWYFIIMIDETFLVITIDHCL